MMMMMISWSCVSHCVLSYLPWPVLLQVGETSRGQVEEKDVCDMQVYDDPLFQYQVSRFPYTASSATGIYIQASAQTSVYSCLTFCSRVRLDR